jgi:hypothetical protein
MGGRPRLILPATAAALLVLAGCGGGDDPESPVAASSSASAAERAQAAGEVVDIAGTEPGAQAVGEMTAGSVASLVECRDWNGASEEQKLATIADVRSQINLGDSGIEAPELTDAEAMAMFDSSCEPAYAGGFRLYKLYARAIGFVGLKRMLDARSP